jgi:Domain of unknown function (DUF4288)
MSYTPKDAHWFIGQLVEEFRVEGSKRNAVHINSVLIEASSPEQAYQKAVELGRQANNEYENPEGKKVVHRFAGLRNLDVIYFPIEHGCEIMFEERLGVGPAALRKLVRKKNDLEAFRPVPLRRPRGRPNYSSKEIMGIVGTEMSRRKGAEQAEFRRRRVRASVGNRKSKPRRA